MATISDKEISILATYFETKNFVKRLALYLGFKYDRIEAELWDERPHTYWALFKLLAEWRDNMVVEEELTRDEMIEKLLKAAKFLKNQRAQKFLREL